MPFKKLICLVFFSLTILAVAAQVSNSIDSLEQVLAGVQNNQKKFDLMMDLSEKLFSYDINKSLHYAEEAYKLAEKEGDKNQELRASYNLAKVYYYLSDLNNAMEYATKTRALAEELNLLLDQALAADAIGIIYYDIGYQAKSSEHFFTSLKIYEKLDDKEGIGANLCRIGTLYLDQNDYDKAVEYYTKSIEIAREINSNEGIASNLNNLAKVYFEKQEYDRALEIFEEALAINLKEENSYLVASNYLNIADVYLEMKQYPVAISNLQSAEKMFEKLGNKLRLVKTRLMLAEVYFASGQMRQSEDLAVITLKIGMENNYKEIIVLSSGLLSKLNLAKSDSAAAFRYFSLEQQYQDSLFLEEKQKTLTKLELQYQFEKIENELKIARQRRNTAIFIISTVLLLSLIIIVLIWKQLKLKARKMQLEKANYEKELEFKNKEMVLNVMSLMKKNEMLAGLSEKLISIDEETTSPESKDTIKKVAVEIQKSQEKEIWKEFSMRFKEVHGDFYNKLLEKFPTLTPNELKLCAFLRLNMSSKDIAELTGQRVTSLETARYRLRQKLGIANSDVNLVTFLSTL